VAACRHRITATLGRLPMRAYAPDDPTDDTPWVGDTDLITQPDPAEPQFRTMVKTLDDLLFDGTAYWGVTAAYNGKSPYQRPKSVVYIPRNCVQVDDVGRPTIDTAFTKWLWDTQLREIVPNRMGWPWVLLFEGPHGGLLNFGSRTIRSSVRMDRAASRAADNPVPSIELHQTNDADMTDTQIKDMLRAWMSARRGENGGVGYTSSGVEARALGQQPEQLLIDGRNQQAVEVARLAGIPAASIDAGLPGTSLTYANLMDRLRDLVDFGLQPYGVAVTSRLSMNDCLPGSATVRFDYSSLVAPTTSAAAAAAPIPARPPSQAAPIPEGTPA
jgi:hypothetical protein